MDAFAGRLFRILGAGNPFQSRDGAFILAFSTIMLNTDLHNENIPEHKKMTLADFIRSTLHPYTPLAPPITHYPLPITHYPLPITHYPLMH
jgi:hypothetical protein